MKSSGHRDLDVLALDAPLHFVYAPAEVDGHAVDSILKYRYMFEAAEE